MMLTSGSAGSGRHGACETDAAESIWCSGRTSALTSVRVTMDKAYEQSSTENLEVKAK